MSEWDVASELRGAVVRGEILAYFQPQIDLATGSTVGAEALARWNHPSRGIVEPGVFIPVAEETGLIHELGDFMLEEGCRCAASWRDLGLDIEVAVNVAAAQLETSAFFEHLDRVTSDAQLEPRLLTIEVTESQVIADLDEVATRLGDLRDRGFGISIDDFGTGHSSVSQLVGLPATEVKIDQNLIGSPSRASKSLMSAVVGLSKARGLRVVAEGVETAESLDHVRTLGFDRVQGFLFGRPVPRDEFEHGLLERAD